MIDQTQQFLGWALTVLFSGLAIFCLSHGNWAVGSGLVILAIAVCPHSPLSQWTRLSLIALGIVLT